MCGRKDVLGREHENVGLKLCLYTEGDVNSHLVSVKVSVEGGTYQGVELYSLSFYENGFKSLYGGSVECGSSVEEDGVLLDHLFQAFPNFGSLLFNELFGVLYGGCVSLFF